MHLDPNEPPFGRATQQTTCASGAFLIAGPQRPVRAQGQRSEGCIGGLSEGLPSAGLQATCLRRRLSDTAGLRRPNSRKSDKCVSRSSVCRVGKTSELSEQQICVGRRAAVAKPYSMSLRCVQ